MKDIIAGFSVVYLCGITIAWLVELYKYTNYKAKINIAAIIFWPLFVARYLYRDFIIAWNRK
jgi:hypothetical protein